MNAACLPRSSEDPRLSNVSRKTCIAATNHDTEHVFGGQVLAQAIAAAYRTVSAPHQHLHSIHAYFLRAGDWKRPHSVRRRPDS